MTDYTLAPAVPDEVRDALKAYSPFLQQLLYTRGIIDAAAAASFVEPDYDTGLNDPFLLHDMGKAVTRIETALAAGEHVTIYSDYDCDGIPGGVILHDFFNAIGYTNFANHIPHRHYEGFGLNVAAVERLAAEGTNLIITIDCGTSDVAAVARANELGVDVIVTDHHQPHDTLPLAVAIVNPQLGDTYPFKGLCGAAVVFKVVQALIAHGSYDLRPGWEKWWLDMVGIATIADLVPLTDENRVLARYGLQVLRKSRRPGLQQLLRQQRAAQQHLTEDDIGFTIGPRINAASRMDTPEDAFAMLATTDVGEAGERVAHLEKLNNERKGAVAAMTKEIHKRLKDVTEIPAVLVIGNPEWRPSLAGIAANSLAEEYRRPVFVWGRDGTGVIKGSTRSDGEASVVRLMEATSDHFTEYGGHHMAGGFSVADEHIHTLSDALNTAHAKLGDAAKVREPLVVDHACALAELTELVLREQEQLAPFGVGNAKPLYRVTATPVAVEIFGKTKEHTKLRFDTDGIAKEAIAFFKLPEHFSVTPEANMEVTLLAHLERSWFMNRPQVRLRIIDIVG